jgi:hypothetical protein
MSLTFSKIKSYAPIVKLHPLEEYCPMDPVDFIKISRFRHHRGFRKDEGFNKIRKKFVESNSRSSQYYNIPISTINSYGLVRGKNRRPKDDNKTKYINVFLQPDNKPRGVAKPTGKVPAFYYQRTVDTTTLTKKQIRLLKKMGVTLKKEVYDLVSYWWFMGYNDAPYGVGHQGDWEHVTLKLVDNKFKEVWFAAHNGPPMVINKNKLNYDKSTNRFIVYCARGTHASYPKPGKFKIKIDYFPDFVNDETHKSGYPWDISQNLKSLSSQPWKNYAGAWGEVGNSQHTTGPLGPWHKRHRK